MEKKQAITGGYILQPRTIKGSDIANAVPYVREIWYYLLREANSSNQRYAGNWVKRGQLFRNYKTIREDLAWFIGYRKETYNANQVKKAMKYLRDTQRITTRKALGGVLITICKYDFYQNPKNYIRTNDSANTRTITEPILNQPPAFTNKNDKNKSKKEDVTPSISDFKQYFIDNGYPSELAERAYTGYEVANWHDSKGSKIKNWKQKCQHVWFKPENKANEQNTNTEANYKPFNTMNQR